ncbi:flippase-like domain-containing protein [Halococcus thailandensis]|uniref:Dolichol-P-glucose synthetase n=1 Tax=Halococcus thailandensis JCM 13552 TaxID=1227457 RepID=M0N1K6_9EURY|nr:flippase-like domain-containing protein [Halococcus thailandensis]EMA51852.1 dolichol-P-glucose synthetase [Halococcus thailandensis JCM 13552]
MSSVAVSVVLPAYDEQRTLAATVETTLDTLGSFLPDDSFEVLVAEDGCTDDTPEIAARLAREDDRIRHVHSDERLGRGGALTRAFRAARGDTLAYFDTDLATDMSHLEELVTSVRSGEYDVATGSRLLAASDADRPANRDVPSRVYNGLVRLFLRSSVHDHQCGFKAFDRAVLDDLLTDVEDDHWFWDTELLVRAQRAGYRVREFPVDWTPKGDTKVDFVRDVLGMGSGVLRTWWQLAVAPRITRRVTLVAGTLLTLLAVALMPQYIDVSRMLAEIETADPALVVAAALVYVLSWPLRGGRYRDILEELGYTEGLGFLTGAVFISQTGNLVFPARAGDAVRAYVVKTRRRVPYPTGFASLAVERVFDLLTITLLAGVVLVGLAATGITSLSGLGATVAGGNQSGRVALLVASGVGVAAIALVGAIVASARSDRNLVRRGMEKVSSDAYADRVAGVIERFVGDVQAVAGDRGAFARIGASSVVIWTLDVVTALLVFAAFDVALPLTTLVAVGFFAVSVGNLAKVLPLSPGGLGLYEGAFSLLVVGLTPVATPIALGAAIVDHAVKNVVTVVGGLASMLVLNVSLTTAVEESRDVEATPTDD